MQTTANRLCPLHVTPETIENYRQNNPELVIRDAADYLGLSEEECDGLRKILLARGVNKWLKVRRDLIAYKKRVKHQIKELHARRMDAKAAGRYHEANGLWHAEKALIQVRADLCRMCKSARWVIWPRSCSRNALKAMNTIRCAD